MKIRRRYTTTPRSARTLLIICANLYPTTKSTIFNHGTHAHRKLYIIYVYTMYNHNEHGRHAAIHYDSYTGERARLTTARQKQ